MNTILYTKWYCNLIFLLAITNSLYGQTIKGKLLDVKTREPITGANVFLANTSLGSVSDEKGIFEIKKISQNSVELVVSMIGYETFVMPLLVDTLRNRSITIMMTEKIEEIEAVTVKAKHTNWKRDYQIFQNYFIGQTENALKCKIKNPDILNFSNKNRIFKAYADDFLIVENNKLGYILKYKLIDFQIDFKDNYFVILGYPFFELMKGSKRQEKKWEKARYETYKGSCMHLIRSLYEQNWEKEGFLIKKLVRMPNKERPSDSLIRSKVNYFREMNQMDSLEKWASKSRLPKQVQYLSSTPFKPIDSIVTHYPKNSILKKLQVDHCLHVTYTKAKVSSLYSMTNADQTSVLSLSKPYILLQKDGYIIETLDITYEGYMPWKKMADLLPLDYQIPQK